MLSLLKNPIMSHLYLKIRIIVSLLFVVSLGINISWGQMAKDTAIVDYKAVDKAIHEKILQYGAQDVLVVMDIDNTILTSDTDLGSDIWYRWQRGKLEIKPREDQLLDSQCLFGEAISLLYELGTMSLTDSLLPGLISNWQNEHVTVFALTSRSPQCRPATERELLRYGIDLSFTSLRTPDGQEVLFTRDSDTNLSYLNGIFMTAGGHKGDKLAEILERSGRSFKSIIVVDDYDINITNFKERASSYRAGDISLFYYTKIETERLKQNNNVILTPKQAKKMDRDWDKLIRRLNKIFPERMGKSECT